MVRINAVHMAGGTSHEHISGVRWVNPSTGKAGDSTTGDVVLWIEGGGTATVQDSQGSVAVGVVDAKPNRYLRTHADGRWTDNLLALPRF